MLTARVARPALRQLRASLAVGLLSSSSHHAALSTCAAVARSCAPSHLRSTVAGVPLVARRSFATHTVVVPSMGDSISEGTLAEITVQAGSSVATDDVIAKIETDKVTVDIRTTVGGAVTKWLAKAGDNVKVGAPLAEVEIGASASASTPSAPTDNVHQSGAVQTQASKPTADVGSSNTSPVAQSGTHAPQSIHPKDPSAQDPMHAHRVPMIHFRFGKRPASPAARGGAHQHQGNQLDASTPVVAADFMKANEAAAAAYDALPAYYKRRPLKLAVLTEIELGGAANYEPKKKAKAA